MRIAILEDHIQLADGMARAFQAEGHGVDLLYDGNDAVHFLINEPIDLIILDVNLPGRTGLEVLRDVRNAQVETPVILVTARDTTNDKVAGLDLGADDYLTKPFELPELLARARALLRRGNKAVLVETMVGELKFDAGARSLSIRGLPVDLPRRELALAELLISRAGHVISKNQILDHLYGVGADVEESAAELYIHRLRKKLQGAGIVIKTIRGLGYCLREVP